MPDRDVNYQLVIRPSVEHYHRMLKTTPVFLLIFVGIMVARGGLVGLIAAVIIAAVTYGIVMIYLKRAFIGVTLTDIVRVGLTGRQIKRPRSDVSAVVRATMPASVMDSRQFYNLFVLDRIGERILRLKNSHWREDDMNHLVEVLGLHPVDFPEVISAKEFTMHYPNVLPLVERRQVAWGFGAGCGIVLAVIVFAVIFVTLTR